YTACDGSTADWTHTYDIDYSGGMAMVPANTSSTVSCAADATDPGNPGPITDACGRTVNAVLVGPESTPDPVTCEGSVVWRYRYTACDGSTADWTHTYDIDYSGGMAMVPANTSSTVSCAADATDPGNPGPITDACGRTVNAVLVGPESTPDPVTCEGSVVWRYRYTACDGSTADWTHTYDIDYSGGMAMVPANTSSTVSCAADATDPGNPGPITDACGRTVNAVLMGFSDTPDPITCNGTRTWTYRYTACDGTIADWTYTYHIQDNTAPSVLTRNTTVFLNASGAASISTADVDDGSYDNCGGTLSLSLDKTLFNCNDTGTQTVYLTATDCAGNHDTQPASVLVKDTIPPVIQLLGPSSVQLQLYGNYVEPGATASDNCGGDLSGNIIIHNPVNTSIPGTYIVTYDIIDASGISAKQKARTVTVTENALVQGENEVCAGETTVYTTDPGMTNYVWTITGGTGSSTTHTITVTWGTGPAGNVAISYTNPGGGSSKSTPGSLDVTIHPLPTVTVNTTTYICSGQPATPLQGGSPAGGTWLGAYVNQGMFTPQGLQPGNYPVEYTYIDINGCSSTATSNVVIHPLPIANAGQDVGICPGVSTQLVATGGTDYEWSNGGQAATQSVAPLVTTMYTVTVTDANGCSAADDVIVTVHPLPGSIVQPMEICMASCTTLTAPAGQEYLWSNGLTQGSIQVCPSNSQTYAVTVTNQYGCKATSYFIVQLKFLPFVYAGPDTDMCEGDTIELQVSGAGSYAWNTGNTSTQVLVSPSITTTYTVTGTAANGCTATDAILVTVHPLPVTTITPVNPMVCAGSCMDLTASGGVHYAWNEGSSTAMIVVCPTATTLYQVTATNQFGCQGTAEVQAGIYPAITLDAGNDTSVYIGDEALLNPTIGNGNIAQFQWTPALTLNDPALMQPLARPYETTTYTLEAGYGPGCTASDQVTVFVLPRGNSMGGQIVYDNIYQTPMPNFGIILSSLDKSIHDTIFSGPKGLFYADSLPAGTYIIRAYSEQPWAWGGVNASDALGNMRHFVGLDSLTGVRWLAGDVEKTNFINSTDALQIGRRFAGLINAFDIYDWVLVPDTLNFATETLYTKVHHVLAAGDVNRSYIPTLKTAPDGALRSEDIIEAKTNAAVAIPVGLGQACKPGSLSLQIIIPDGLQIRSIDCGEGIGGELIYGIQGNTLNIAWFSLNAYPYQPGTPFLTIHAMTSGKSGTLHFEAGAAVELTDNDNNVIKNVIVEIPGLRIEEDGNMSMHIYPNPVRDEASLQLFLSAAGHAELEIVNTLGARQLLLHTGYLEAGTHLLSATTGKLPPGVYFIRLQLQNEAGVQYLVSRFIVQQ
ncbi:MAG TPA: DUF5011 domain-containing protein, partial [Bacteroidales bacterium]|nr:DUF5011 domain-containing protein [Bacteroidales bacterium]